MNERVSGVPNEIDAVAQHAEAMRTLLMEPWEEIAIASAALALRFGERTVEEGGGQVAAPTTAEPLIEAHRPERIGHRLWRRAFICRRRRL